MIYFPLALLEEVINTNALLMRSMKSPRCDKRPSPMPRKTICIF